MSYVYRLYSTRHMHVLHIRATHIILLLYCLFLLSIYYLYCYYYSLYMFKMEPTIVSMIQLRPTLLRIVFKYYILLRLLQHSRAIVSKSLRTATFTIRLAMAFRLKLIVLQIRQEKYRNNSSYRRLQEKSKRINQATDLHSVLPCTLRNIIVNYYDIDRARILTCSENRVFIFHFLRCTRAVCTVHRTGQIHCT